MKITLSRNLQGSAARRVTKGDEDRAVTGRFSPPVRVIDKRAKRSRPRALCFTGSSAWIHQPN
jgi:hypothetical protein